MEQIEFLKHLIDDAESEIKYIEEYKNMRTLSEKKWIMGLIL